MVCLLPSVNETASETAADTSTETRPQEQGMFFSQAEARQSAGGQPTMGLYVEEAEKVFGGRQGRGTNADLNTTTAGCWAVTLPQEGAECIPPRYLAWGETAEQRNRLSGSGRWARRRSQAKECKRRDHLPEKKALVCNEKHPQPGCIDRYTVRPRQAGPPAKVDAIAAVQGAELTDRVFSQPSS